MSGQGGEKEERYSIQAHVVTHTWTQGTKLKKERKRNGGDKVKVMYADKLWLQDSGLCVEELGRGPIHQFTKTRNHRGKSAYTHMTG